MMPIDFSTSLEIWQLLFPWEIFGEIGHKEISILLIEHDVVPQMHLLIFNLFKLLKTFSVGLVYYPQILPDLLLIRFSIHHQLS